MDQAAFEAVSNVAEGVSNVQITEDSTSPSASDDATPMSDAAESDVTSTSTSSSAPTSNETSGSTGGDAAQDQGDQDAEDDGEDYGDDDEDYGDEDDGEDEGADKGPKPVVEDSREHLNVVFIGHVDAGKSTISGNLLYLQGVVDERTIQKYEREAKEKNRDSWYYAYIMDTNEEERAKGKTVEVGRAHFETPVKRYTILDAPGHKNYVPNMIGGAAQADIGILVISARKGEFETGFDRGGQTREHATLAKTLGVRQIVVAINKMDESTVLWSKERYDEIVDKLTPFLKSIGYNPKSDITFLPVSGITGANLKVRTDLSVCPWYNGPALVDLLDGLKPLDRNETGPLRIPVLDRYKDRGIAFVMGKIESGTIHKGQPVVVMPMKKRSEVLMVELETGEVPRARPGENVNIGLSNVTLADIQQGFVVCDVDNQIPCVTEFEAQLAIIDLLPHKSIVSAGYSAILHVHTAAVEVSITDLLSALDKKTRQPSKRKPAFGKKGDVITALIRTEATLCLELFSTLQQLGRFTLRDEGKTIAIGKVTALR